MRLTMMSIIVDSGSISTPKLSVTPSAPAAHRQIVAV
jgi:hypothetical protein